MKNTIKKTRLLVRVIVDLIRGMWALPAAGDCVTVFGSARLDESNDEYRVAYMLGSALAAREITIMTGGGAGLMEAVCRGAQASGGRTMGCRIRLSAQQRANPRLDQSATFRYFFVRKVMMIREAQGFVVLPGGLGTLDESFEVLTLMQMKKLAEHPIVFIGTSYWKPLLELIHSMEQRGTIRPAEMAMVRRLVLFTDDVDLAVAHVQGQAPAHPQAAPRGTGQHAVQRGGASSGDWEYPVQADALQPTSGDAA